MEIVTRGNPEKGWPREYESPCCGSVLRIDAADIKESRDWLGDHNHYFIDCPVCGERQVIPAPMRYAAERWLRQQEQAQSG